VVREYGSETLQNLALMDQARRLGGAEVAESIVLLACPPGRSRLLRAAWRPCSRGSARRAAVVGARNSEAR
jgi:hypothetical protein